MIFRAPLPPLPLPDQSGRTWLVTGATHGLGVEVAKAGANAGARVVITARDLQRGRDVQREIGAHSVVELDLADLRSVRQAASFVHSDVGPVDVLVNNAGTLSITREATHDGFEKTLGTNVLGPFAFTNLVLPAVRARITIVASEAHRGAQFDRRDPHRRSTEWSTYKAYQASKLADLWWAGELARKVADRGITVTTADPGWAATNIQSGATSRLVSTASQIFSRGLAQSAADGAQPILAAAAAPVPSGTYLGPSGPGNKWGPPTMLRPTDLALDPGNAAWFWAFAAEQTGTDLP